MKKLKNNQRPPFSKISPFFSKNNGKNSIINKIPLQKYLNPIANSHPFYKNHLRLKTPLILAFITPAALFLMLKKKIGLSSTLTWTKKTVKPSQQIRSFQNLVENPHQVLYFPVNFYYFPHFISSQIFTQRKKEKALVTAVKILPHSQRPKISKFQKKSINQRLTLHYSPNFDAPLRPKLFLLLPPKKVSFFLPKKFTRKNFFFVRKSFGRKGKKLWSQKPFLVSPKNKQNFRIFALPPSHETKLNKTDDFISPFAGSSKNYWKKTISTAFYLLIAYKLTFRSKLKHYLDSSTNTHLFLAISPFLAYFIQINLERYNLNYQSDSFIKRSLPQLSKPIHKMTWETFAYTKYSNKLKINSINEVNCFDNSFFISLNPNWQLEQKQFSLRAFELSNKPMNQDEAFLSSRYFFQVYSTLFNNKKDMFFQNLSFKKAPAFNSSVFSKEPINSKNLKKEGQTFELSILRPIIASEIPFWKNFQIEKKTTNKKQNSLESHLDQIIKMNSRWQFLSDKLDDIPTKLDSLFSSETYSLVDQPIEINTHEEKSLTDETPTKPLEIPSLFSFIKTSSLFESDSENNFLQNSLKSKEEEDKTSSLGKLGLEKPKIQLGQICRDCLSKTFISNANSPKKKDDLELLFQKHFEVLNSNYKTYTQNLKTKAGVDFNTKEMKKPARIYKTSFSSSKYKYIKTNILKKVSPIHNFIGFDSKPTKVSNLSESDLSFLPSTDLQISNLTWIDFLSHGFLKAFQEKKKPLFVDRNFYYNLDFGFSRFGKLSQVLRLNTQTKKNLVNNSKNQKKKVDNSIIFKNNAFAFQNLSQETLVNWKRNIKKDLKEKPPLWVQEFEKNLSGFYEPESLQPTYKPPSADLGAPQVLLNTSLPSSVLKSETSFQKRVRLPKFEKIFLNQVKLKFDLLTQEIAIENPESILTLVKKPRKLFSKNQGLFHFTKTLVNQSFKTNVTENSLAQRKVSGYLKPDHSRKEISFELNKSFSQGNRYFETQELLMHQDLALMEPLEKKAILSLQKKQANLKNRHQMFSRPRFLMSNDNNPLKKELGNFIIQVDQPLNSLFSTFPAALNLPENLLKESLARTQESKKLFLPEQKLWSPRENDISSFLFLLDKKKKQNGENLKLNPDRSFTSKQDFFFKGPTKKARYNIISQIGQKKPKLIQKGEQTTPYVQLPNSLIQLTNYPKDSDTLGKEGSLSQPKTVLVLPQNPRFWLSKKKTKENHLSIEGKEDSFDLFLLKAAPSKQLQKPFLVSPEVYKKQKWQEKTRHFTNSPISYRSRLNFTNFKIPYPKELASLNRPLPKGSSKLYEPVNLKTWAILSQLGFAFIIFKGTIFVKDEYMEEWDYYLKEFETFFDDLGENMFQNESDNFRVISKTGKKFSDLVGSRFLLIEFGDIILLLRNSQKPFSQIPISQPKFPDFTQNNKILTKVLTKNESGFPIEDLTSKGILLVGPPGTGKTLLVQALSGEAKVSILIESGKMLNSTLETPGSERLKDLFQKARRMSPCLLFLDEIDKIGQKRPNVISSFTAIEKQAEIPNLLNFIYFQNTLITGANSTNFTKTNTNLSFQSTWGTLNPLLQLQIKLTSTNKLNQENQKLNDLKIKMEDQKNSNDESQKRDLVMLTQLLCELDGLNQRKNLVVIGATNRPATLDPALIRPGRLGKVIYLSLPGKQKRFDLLKFYSTLGVDDSINWDYFANQTVGLSAAHLSAAMNRSALKTIYSFFYKKKSQPFSSMSFFLLEQASNVFSLGSCAQSFFLQRKNEKTKVKKLLTQHSNKKKKPIHTFETIEYGIQTVSTRSTNSQNHLIKGLQTNKKTLGKAFPLFYAHNNQRNQKIKFRVKNKTTILDKYIYHKPKASVKMKSLLTSLLSSENIFFKFLNKRTPKTLHKTFSLREKALVAGGKSFGRQEPKSWMLGGNLSQISLTNLFRNQKKDPNDFVDFAQKQRKTSKLKLLGLPKNQRLKRKNFYTGKKRRYLRTLALLELQNDFILSTKISPIKKTWMAVSFVFNFPLNQLNILNRYFRRIIENQFFGWLFLFNSTCLIKNSLFLISFNSFFSTTFNLSLQKQQEKNSQHVENKGSEKELNIFPKSHFLYYTFLFHSIETEGKLTEKCNGKKTFLPGTKDNFKNQINLFGDSLFLNRSAYYLSGKAIVKLASVLQNPLDQPSCLWSFGTKVPQKRQKQKSHKKPFLNKMEFENFLFSLLAGKASESRMLKNQIGISQQNQSNIGTNELKEFGESMNNMVDQYLFYSPKALVQKQGNIQFLKNTAQIQQNEQPLLKGVTTLFENPEINDHNLLTNSNSRFYDEFEWKGKPWWQFKSNNILSSNNLKYSEWYRFFLTDTAQNLRNIEWSASDTYFHNQLNNHFLMPNFFKEKNKGQKKLLKFYPKFINHEFMLKYIAFSNLNWNQLQLLELESLTTSFLFESFNKIFILLDMHGEFLDDLVYCLLCQENIQEFKMKIRSTRYFK